MVNTAVASIGRYSGNSSDSTSTTGNGSSPYSPRQHDESVTFRLHPDPHLRLYLLPLPPCPCQDALDRYIFNHGDMRVLKVETQWDQTWGFDFNQYAKIFHYAREKGIRLVGLNAPQSLLHLINMVCVHTSTYVLVVVWFFILVSRKANALVYP